MASYGFHSDAADEYLAATRYYLDKAPPLVAAAFVAEIEAAIQTLLASPITWPVKNRKSAATYSNAFPYSLYYRWESAQDRVSIYAIHALQPATWLLAPSAVLKTINQPATAPPSEFTKPVTNHAPVLS